MAVGRRFAPRLHCRTGLVGQSVLYAVLLMPMLFLVFALSIDVGMMQLERLRLHYALDLATVTAASSVDRLRYDQRGEVRLDPIAASSTAREYLLRNLQSLPDTPNPESIAGSAEIAIVNQVPARDPFSGQLVDRPAVCARIHVTHRFALLGWVGLTGTVITITSDAEIRS